MALAVNTPLPTPHGWTTVGAVAVGDQLFGADGHPTRVLAAGPATADRACVAVEFSDRSVVVADADQCWLTDTLSSRQAASAAAARGRIPRIVAAVRSTAEIAATLHPPGKTLHRNHSVTNTRALQAPEAALPVPAYVLGVWLADGIAGRADIVTADPQLIARLDAHGVRLAPVPGLTHHYSLGLAAAGRSLPDRLAALGVLDEKRIPATYLRASEAQRRALLAGLLDTNGTVGTGGIVRCSVTVAELAGDIGELIVSLGYRCGSSTTHVGGLPHGQGRSHTNQFSTAETVFTVARKAATHQGRRTPRSGTMAVRRSITAVRPAGTIAVRAIQVDNPTGLYLVGRALIPTQDALVR